MRLATRFLRGRSYSQFLANDKTVSQLQTKYLSLRPLEWRKASITPEQLGQIDKLEEELQAAKHEQHLILFDCKNKMYAAEKRLKHVNETGIELDAKAKECTSEMNKLIEQRATESRMEDSTLEESEATLQRAKEFFEKNQNLYHQMIREQEEATKDASKLTEEHNEQEAKYTQLANLVSDVHRLRSTVLRREKEIQSANIQRVEKRQTRLFDLAVLIALAFAGYHLMQFGAPQTQKKE